MKMEVTTAVDNTEEIEQAVYSAREIALEMVGLQAEG